MTQFHKTFFDTPLLVLWGDKSSDDEDARAPRLTFGFRDGRPRFNLSTGSPDKDNSFLSWGSDVANATACMLMLSDIANGPNDTQVRNDNLASAYVEGKRTNEKKVKASLLFGKTKEGIVYISITAEGFPKIVFPFKTSEWHVFRDQNREVMPMSAVSAKLALAYSENVRTAISHVIMAHASEEYTGGVRKLASTDRNAEGGGSQGKYQSKNGGSAANTSKFDDLDDIAL